MSKRSKRGNKTAYIHLSDLEFLGAVFYRKNLVQNVVLSRKYFGILQWEGKEYRIYVNYGFYVGARVCGIAAPEYRNETEAKKACISLNEKYHKALFVDYGELKKRRRQRWGLDVVVHMIAMFVVFLYLKRGILVATAGMDGISLELSILYSVILGLCYIVHYKLQ